MKVSFDKKEAFRDIGGDFTIIYCKECGCHYCILSGASKADGCQHPSSSWVSILKKL